MVRRGRSVAALLGTVATLNSSCAGWTRIDVGADTTFGRRQQVQVWSGGRAQVVHAVRIQGDSLFAVPFHEPPSCDSCRIALPRARVDSLRAGDQEFPAIVTIVVTVGGGLALLYSWARGLRD
jgi:hypothetical protein